MARIAHNGECDPPDETGKEIRIDQAARGKQLLDNLIHEMIHAAFWHIDEEYVTKLATDMAREIMPYIDLIAREGK